jgi:hypothetical protein
MFINLCLGSIKTIRTIIKNIQSIFTLIGGIIQQKLTEAIFISLFQSFMKLSHYSFLQNFSNLTFL